MIIFVSSIYQRIFFFLATVLSINEDIPKKQKDSLYGVVDNMLECDIRESEFEFQSSYLRSILD